jgi:monoamine oxidase
MNTESRSQKVLVIGAGIAGLAAAQKLQKNGFQVTVLEGRDRIGGRIYTDRSLGFPVDLGASWMHGITDNPIGTLAQKGQISIVPTDWDHTLVYDSNGNPISDDDADASLALCQEIREQAKLLAETWEKDLSFAAAVEQILASQTLTPQQSQLVRWWLNCELVLEIGADLESISSWWVDEGEILDRDDYLFPQGYDQIIDGLAKNLDIHLQQKVTEINYFNYGVSVTTDRGNFTADATIVTLPLGVLQSGTIKFSPLLPPNKQAAINRLKMSSFNKIILKFPYQFWPEEYHAFDYLCEGEADFFCEFLNLAIYSQQSALMAFTGGSFAEKIEQLSEAEIVERIMLLLRRSYGEIASATLRDRIPQPESVMITRWNQDPFSFGAYSYIPVGGDISDRDILAEPVGDRLFFAGEATDRDYASTVHGAYLSGIREAKRIINSSL